MKIAVVVPTFNEADRIEKTLGDLVAANFDVIVVDDGSTDSTETLVRNFPVNYVQHIINRGQGAALKTGTELAFRLGYDVIAHFDADGQHRIEDLHKIIKLIDNNAYDIVLGSRFLDAKTEFPWKKKIVLNIAKVFSNKILKLNFTDPQSGLRVFQSKSLEMLNWQKDDFQHCTEILSLILKNGLKYKEVPIIVNYDIGQKAVRPKMSMGIKLIFNKLFD